MVHFDSPCFERVIRPLKPPRQFLKTVASLVSMIIHLRLNDDVTPRDRSLASNIFYDLVILDVGKPDLLLYMGTRQ